MEVGTVTASTRTTADIKGCTAKLPIRIAMMEINETGAATMEAIARVRGTDAFAEIRFQESSVRISKAIALQKQLGHIAKNKTAISMAIESNGI